MDNLWYQAAEFASSVFSSSFFSSVDTPSSAPSTPTPRPLPTILPATTIPPACDESPWHPHQLYSSFSALVAPYTESLISPFLDESQLLPILLWTILSIYLLIIIVTLIRGALAGEEQRECAPSTTTNPSTESHESESSSLPSSSRPPSQSLEPAAAETSEFDRDEEEKKKRKKEEKQKAKAERLSRKKQKKEDKAKKKRAKEEARQREENEGGLRRKVRNLLRLTTKRKEPIYDEASVVLLQRLWRGRAARKQLSVHKKRQRIVQEIVDTEQSYVQALQTMITCYLLPLRARSTAYLASSQPTVPTADSYFHVALRNLNASLNIPTMVKMKKKNSIGKDKEKMEKKRKKPLITTQDLKTIFSQTEVIYNFNNHFLQIIRERVTKWHYEQTIGDIFLNVMDFYKVYTECVNGYSAAMMALTACESNKKFCRFLEDCNRTAAEMGGLRSLPSYLIQPVQRLPRYVLLLKDLLKHTREGHPDFGNLTKATQRMCDVAQMVDERHKQAELLNHMFQLQNETKGLSRGYDFATLESAEITTIATGPLLAPHRRLTKMGKLSFSVEGMSPRMEEVQCYLFTDLLLIISEQQSRASPRMGRVCRYRLPLLTLSLASSASSKVAEEGGKFMLSTSRETFVFRAKDAEEGAEWTTSLRDNIRRLLEKQASFETAKQGKKEERRRTSSAHAE